MKIKSDKKNCHENVLMAAAPSTFLLNVLICPLKTSNKTLKFLKTKHVSQNEHGSLLSFSESSIKSLTLGDSYCLKGIRFQLKKVKKITCSWSRSL